MKKMCIISAIAALFAFVSCSGDGGSGGSGTSEATAIKGTSMAIGNGVNGVFTGGAAFMYSSRGMVNFLLCEGDAKNWNDALKKPHLEVHILQGLILKDITAMADISKAIDINDPSYANVECPVSVRWNVGNGMRFQGKYGYQGGTNNYVFEYGRLMVGKGPLNGMYSIAFVGNGVDKDNNKWDADWSYGGQFTHK